MGWSSRKEARIPGPLEETTEVDDVCERLEDKPDGWEDLSWDEPDLEEPDFTRLTSRHRGAAQRAAPIHSNLQPG